MFTDVTADRQSAAGQDREIAGWTAGNRLMLLENGEEFFPALFASIENARESVALETFIWFEDEIGNQLAELLCCVAKKGIEVSVLVDGYGTPRFSHEFLARLRTAGVRTAQFDPQPSLFGIRTNFLCRMHRKVVVIDREVAYVGGINISDDHLVETGPESKQDYAVEVRGPVVEQIRRCVLQRQAIAGGLWWRRWRYWIRLFPKFLRAPDATGGLVLFATRDNNQHPTDIETLYRMAIRKAENDITIANAYFFPGYRFIRDLRRARRRGVNVRLIIQGKPDMPIKLGMASVLLDDLAAEGVKVYRFMRRPLHAKVAVVDQHWSTVGSSNLDPTSLGLNYEANIFALDREFNESLRKKLDRIIEESCEEFAVGLAPVSRARRILAACSYHLTRRLPTWGSRVLRRNQSVTYL